MIQYFVAMTLTPLAGHLDARARLGHAIDSDRLPQVLLLTGDPGVGKQRLAAWIAQRLLCEAPNGEPCGNCLPCQRVLNLTHPDVHWLIPVPRPKAGDPAKQVDEVAGLIEAALTERREQGRWTAPDGMESHGIASARLLQRHAGLTSVEGGWRVFIIAHAERLVPQESSPEAANALLKLLEEPPARSVFVLTAPEPGMVLTTIRSRSVPLRVGRVGAGELTEWARTQEISADAATIRAAGGSPGRLLAGGEHGSERRAAERVLEAVAGSAAERSELALSQGVSAARGAFTELLDSLASVLEGRARAAATRSDWAEIGSSGAAIERVMRAREQAQGNVNPQLALAVLMDDLATLEREAA